MSSRPPVGEPSPPGAGQRSRLGSGLDPEDFYLEDGLMVFTRAYHLKRGFCCRSGCRHCPWDFSGERERTHE